jgi:hypothetical protein
MTVDLTVLRAHLEELTLLAERAPPARRARLEDALSILAGALETITRCRKAVERTHACLDRHTGPQGKVRFSHRRTRQ